METGCYAAVDAKNAYEKISGSLDRSALYYDLYKAGIDKNRTKPQAPGKSCSWIYGIGTSQ